MIPFHYLLLDTAPAWLLPGVGAQGSDLDFANGRYFAGGQSNIDSILTTTRASTGYAQTSSGLLVPFASNIPRITDQGLLVEEARTNLALQSQSFDNAAWTASSSTVTPDDATAPDGTLTADKVLETNTVSSLVRSTAALTVVSGSTYQIAIYIKPSNIQWVRLAGSDVSGGTNSGQAWFDLTGGAVGTQSNTGTGWTINSASISAVANGFYRLVISVTTGATTMFVRLHSTTTNGGTTRVTNGTYWPWQADVQLGTFATSPIPTSTVAVTRAADVVALSGAAATAAAAAQACFLQTYLVNAVGNKVLLRWKAGTAGATSAKIYFGSTTSVLVNTGPNETAGISVTDFLLVNKIAAAFDGTSFWGRANGGTIKTSANPWANNATPVNLGGNTSASENMCGYIQRVAFGPTKGQFDGLTA